jgi:hypothetical protein
MVDTRKHASATSGAAGGVAAGTVSRVDGDTLYIKEPSGETVQVKLLSTTTISTSLGVSGHSVRPGRHRHGPRHQRQRRHDQIQLDQRLRKHRRSHDDHQPRRHVNELRVNRRHHARRTRSAFY